MSISATPSSFLNARIMIYRTTRRILRIALLAGCCIHARASAPKGLVITVTSPTEVKLLWKDNSSDEVAFTVERRISGGEFETLATLPANTTSFHDKGLTSGKTYAYRVSATYKAGPPAGIEARVSLTPPAEPRGMLGWSPSGKEIAIQWTDRSENEDGFVIERRSEERRVGKECA